MRRTRPRRTRITALATLAMLNLFTLAAGVAVARMLPPRLAALRIPVAAVRPVLRPGTVLPPVAAGTAGSGSGADPGSLPTAAGLAAMLGSTLPAGETGPQVGLEVADARTGKVLYAENGSTLATPASTTKVATAVAALAVLGPDARFTTSVRKVSGGIVLVGGGDPTLAVNELPLLRLPAARHAGRARGQHGPGAQGPGRHPCAARLRHFPLHRPRHGTRMGRRPHHHRQRHADRVA